MNKMENTKVKSYQDSICSTLDNIVNAVTGLSEEVICWKPSKEEWSILQILSHIAESTVYWLDEMETVLESPGTKWGRGLDNSERLAAVNNLEDINIEQVISQVKGLKLQVKNRLSHVRDDNLVEENPHRNLEKFGNKSVAFLIEHFLVEHIAGHYEQIQRNKKNLKINI